jgi:uncharacterized protein YggU (UPF0235/DUF167 family)
MTGATRAYLRIRVTPRAAQTRLARDARGGLRAHLTAPPVDDAANEALIALLAERLRLPKGVFELTRGARGREKTIAVRGCSAHELDERLQSALDSRVDKTARHG